MFISSDLKWSKHVSNIASKVNKVLGKLVNNLTCHELNLCIKRKKILIKIFKCFIATLILFK